ncbi:hypothetical protein BT69DRAFT_1319406 [Atractiella rhizophila]|nr:hypothetical protein BT69DRAFT_1319406 [Atractiella rhizophila]
MSPSNAALRGYKRGRRSLEESTVDLAKMRSLVQSLNSVKEDLEGIEETATAISQLKHDIEILEALLERAPKKKIAFSSLQFKDLEPIGVKSSGVLVFKNDQIKKVAASIPDLDKESDALVRSLEEIHCCFSMEFEAGSRTIIDAIFISLYRITHQGKLDIAILPEKVPGPDKGIPFQNRETGHILYLSGKVDYLIVQYDSQAQDGVVKSLLLDANNARPYDLVYAIAKARLFVTEAKRLDSRLGYCLPEVIGQALVIAKSAKLSQLKFCLTDGENWIFGLVKQEEDEWTYAVSVVENQKRKKDRTLKDFLRNLLSILSEWVKEAPSDGVYELQSQF